MPLVALVLILVAGEHDLLGIHDDDVVTHVDMRGVCRFVLTLEAHGDQRGKPADDETLGIDQHPLFLHLAGLGAVGLHLVGPRKWRSADRSDDRRARRVRSRCLRSAKRCTKVHPRVRHGVNWCRARPRSRGSSATRASSRRYLGAGQRNLRPATRELIQQNQRYIESGIRNTAYAVTYYLTAHPPVWRGHRCRWRARSSPTHRRNRAPLRRRRAGDRLARAGSRR